MFTFTRAIKRAVGMKSRDMGFARHGCLVILVVCASVGPTWNGQTLRENTISFHQYELQCCFVGGYWRKSTHSGFPNGSSFQQNFTQKRILNLNNSKNVVWKHGFCVVFGAYPKGRSWTPQRACFEQHGLCLRPDE